jgi:dipeptidyl aminopeptidase/acylaminoacyl peptidase
MDKTSNRPLTHTALHRKSCTEDASSNLLIYTHTLRDSAKQAAAVKRFYVVCSILCMLTPVFAQKQASSTQRALTPDDLLALERFGAKGALPDLALSPDGRYIAYVLQRPRSTATVHHQPFLEGNDRADVWLAPVHGGASRNLTNGLADGSGYWWPLWSPDGQRLAMLSTKGGNVRLWMWERSSGRIRLMSERGVNLWSVPAFVWASNQKLVCAVLAEGEKPAAMIVEMQAAETAMREWHKAWRGKEVTASVLESGLPQSVEKRPQGQLLLIDVVRVRQKVIATGNFSGLRLSPDRSSIAFLRQVAVFQPDLQNSLRPRQEIYQLEIADTQEGKILLPRTEEVTNVLIDNFQWSHDAAELAILGTSDNASDSHPRVFRFTLSDQSLRRVTEDNLRVVNIAWSANHQLLVRRQQNSEEGGRNNITHWWLVEGKGTLRNLTTEMKIVPNQLLPASDGSLVGLADGDLWRITTDGATPRNLTANFEPAITAIVLPDVSVTERQSFNTLIIGSRQPGTTALYRFNLTSGQVTPVAKPAPESELVLLNPASKVAVFRSNTRNGSMLTISQDDFQQFHPIVTINTFLRGIMEARVKQIQYRSSDGQNLTAWLVLPLNYQEGQHVPLLVLLYGGLIYGDVPPRSTQLSDAVQSHPQLLASHGYAVLLPSMPIKEDPCSDVTTGVMTAVDKVIEMGIADPRRLGVMGLSYGGYNTYCLVTQTNRFRGAVAGAAASDLTSLWGEFDARHRYGAFPHESSSMKWQVESLQYRMGNPPWKDRERYARNSPLSYVEKVETPVMIVQGDMDYVGIQQGEEFFTALYRQNKRAQFVRYWGEGHDIQSPVNFRDMWQRIFKWFDECLNKKSS